MIKDIRLRYQIETLNGGHPKSTFREKRGSGTKSVLTNWVGVNLLI